MFTEKVAQQVVFDTPSAAVPELAAEVRVLVWEEVHELQAGISSYQLPGGSPEQEIATNIKPRSSRLHALFHL